MPRERATNPRALLLASVSTLALTVAASQALAADQVPPPKAPPPVLKLPFPPPPTPGFTMWMEGAAIFTRGGNMWALNPVGSAFSPSTGAGPAFVGQTPGVGWEFAFGADYRLPANPGWHVSFDFRHGYSGAGDANFFNGFSTESSSFSNRSKFTEHEDHTVADLMIGRDFGFGTSSGQVKFGVRVADLRARQTVQAQHTEMHPSSSESQFASGGGVNINSRSEFFGIGPRVAAEGSTPLNGPWGIDWGGGLAVLFGKQELSGDANGVFASQFAGSDSNNHAQAFTFANNDCNASVNTGIGTIHPFGCATHSAVFNADASAALSYMIAPQVKLSAGLRFDGYWHALPTLAPTLGSTLQYEDRFYWGPFVRLTGQFGGGPSAQPNAVFKAPASPRATALTMWVEGAAIWTGGSAMNAFNPVGPNFSADAPAGPDFVGQTPGVGWEAAFGADYRLPWDPSWHVSFDFRHGASQAGDANFFGGFSTGANQSKFTENEDHTVADLMIGRDFGLGSTTGQVKFGVRVADLRARQNVQAQHAEAHGAGSTSNFASAASVNINSRSEFLGVGPRVAAEGSTPISGPWGIDWNGGLAVLFGEQKLNADVNGVFFSQFASSEGDHSGRGFTYSGNACNTAINTGIGTIHPLNCTSNNAVFNADAAAALSYTFSPQVKLGAGVRFDGYWRALPTLDPSLGGGVHNEDRFYWGPFVRLTGQF